MYIKKKSRAFGIIQVLVWVQAVLYKLVSKCSTVMVWASSTVIAVTDVHILYVYFHMQLYSALGNVLPFAEKYLKSGKQIVILLENLNEL